MEWDVPPIGPRRLGTKGALGADISHGSCYMRFERGARATALKNPRIVFPPPCGVLVIGRFSRPASSGNRMILRGHGAISVVGSLRSGGGRDSGRSVI